MTNRAKGLFLLLALLAGVPLITLLPNQVASIRLAGLSLLWWYAGVAAPLLAWVIAVVWLPGSEAGPATRSK